ncbi:MAG: hypothetical protein ACRC62_35250 [Microcoleus sp.]
MGLDAVELILGWETAFNIEISDSEAFALQTPKMAIDLIITKVGASREQVGICPSIRAYHQIRKAVIEVLGCPRQQIKLNSKLHDIFPKKQRQEAVKKIFDAVGMPESPKFNFGTGILFTPIAIRDLVDWAVARYPSHLIAPEERWTHSQVRCVVRAVIRDIIGESNFHDRSNFIKDIGLS